MHFCNEMIDTFIKFVEIKIYSFVRMFSNLSLDITNAKHEERQISV